MLRKVSAAMVAAGAALVLVGAPAPANASLYIFDITVTGASVCTLSGCGNAPGFASFTYRQTWNISSEGGAFSLDGLTNSYRAGGTGAITPGALDPGLLTVLGLTASPGEVMAQRTVAQNYDGDPVNDDKSARLSFYQLTAATLPNHIYRETAFGESLYATGPGALTQSLSGGSALSNSLTNGATFNFSATAATLNSDDRTGQFLAYNQVDYVGTARYVATPPAPAPEPSEWLLLIAGFGLTGGALRARRAAAKRPALALARRQAAK